MMFAFTLLAVSIQGGWGRDDLQIIMESFPQMSAQRPFPVKKKTLRKNIPEHTVLSVVCMWEGGGSGLENQLAGSRTSLISEADNLNGCSTV